MARKTPLKDRSWYPYAVALSIAVVLFVVLNNLGSIWKGITTFFGFFSTVILGCVLAYIVSPLARVYRNRVFKNVKKEKTRTVLANVLAFTTVILFLLFVLGMVIPQLIESIAMLATNLDGYVESLQDWLNKHGITNLPIDLQQFVDSSESTLNAILSMVTSNMDQIISTAGSVGKGAMNWIIALLLSMYLLAEKDRLKSGLMKLMQEFLPGERYDNTMLFFRRCDTILSRYIVFNLIDSLIVGAANAIFMAILGLPYVGLVSIVVALCNLVPTFGPIVGAVIGALVLVLVKPWYALAFIIFTLVLQTLDGYFIKPRLFGDSLGVPGLWILVGVIVGGAMFGIVGILVAIPAVAIFDSLYHEYFLPWLMHNGPRARAEAKAQAAQKQSSLLDAAHAFGGQDVAKAYADTVGEEFVAPSGPEVSAEGAVAAVAATSAADAKPDEYAAVKPVE